MLELVTSKTTQEVLIAMQIESGVLDKVHLGAVRAHGVEMWTNQTQCQRRQCQSHYHLSLHLSLHLPRSTGQQDQLGLHIGLLYLTRKPVNLTMMVSNVWMEVELVTPWPSAKLVALQHVKPLIFTKQQVGAIASQTPAHTLSAHMMERRRTERLESTFMELLLMPSGTDHPMRQQKMLQTIVMLILLVLDTFKFKEGSTTSCGLIKGSSTG